MRCAGPGCSLNEDYCERYDVRNQLVRHLHANMVSVPGFRWVAGSHLRKADPTDVAPDEIAYSRLHKLSSDLSVCDVVNLFWKAVGRSR